MKLQNHNKILQPRNVHQFFIHFFLSSFFLTVIAEASLCYMFIKYFDRSIIKFFFFLQHAAVRILFQLSHLI